SQAPRNSRQPCAIPTSPVQLPADGPPTITYSISGCAQSNDLKSPRSQAARSERTRSRFADISQGWHVRRLKARPALGVYDRFDRVSAASDSALASEAEVGKCALAVVVDNESRD